MEWWDNAAAPKSRISLEWTSPWTASPSPAGPSGCRRERAEAKTDRAFFTTKGTKITKVIVQEWLVQLLMKHLAFVLFVPFVVCLPIHEQGCPRKLHR